MRKLYFIFVSCIALSIFNLAIMADGTDESQNLNEIILKVNKLKEKDEYDEIIKLMNDEIGKGKNFQLYFDILGGAYAGKKNSEDAYLSYLKGHLYNPTTEYSRDKLVKKMKYIENRASELDKNSWIAKYLTAKKLFDDGDIINAEKKVSELSSEGKNLDVLCILNKDIKSFKDVPKDSKAVVETFSEAESMFNKVIATQGNNCPEYVYYELADLLFKTSKYEKALPNYQISVTKNAMRRDNLLKVGICQLYIKNYGESKQTFLQCVQKNSQYSEAYLYLGFSHWALKESDKAINAFTTVVNLNSTNNSALKEKAKKAMVVVNKGDLFLTPNDMDKIIKATQPDDKIKSNNENKGKDENEKPVDKK